MTTIIDNRIVDDATAKRVADLFDRATRADHRADVENERAKALLADRGVRAISVITESAALSIMRARDLRREACEILDSCTPQTQTDETWTG